MRWHRWSAAALMACTVCAHAESPEPEQPRLHAIADAVDAGELRATIEKLVSFGTRHTMSDAQSPTRGIGAARRWAQSRFQAISQDCGGCLEVVMPSQTFTGARLPQPTVVTDVVAIQRGTSDPQRVIVITGHIDSRVTDIMNATSDAPGANDDASGVAAVIEAARVLSRHKFRATLVYAALSGEEQGLYGGKVLADHAKAQGWQVQADLNNDIVGNSRGGDGVRDTTTVRVFSEGTKATETQAQANRRRYNGGEVDSPSRNVARYIAAQAERYLTNFHVRMVYRTDRFGRGGDHVTEAHEDYTRQHQDLRSVGGIDHGDTIAGVDFDYLAQVTRLNAVAMAAMAQAPAPPAGVGIEGAVTPHTTLRWKAVPGAVAYRVWWRNTTEAQWTHSRLVGAATGESQSATLRNINIDDWFFGVSSVGADGHESPVVFPGDAGAF